MNYDLRDRDLPTILAEASCVADETKRVFGRLSAEQINWKPSEREWSIGQCFDHLIISNRPYVPIFEEILAVASGKKTKSEINGVGEEEFAPWQIGPTL